MNVAARLEQTAPVGTILIGEDTYRLVRDAVEVEQLEPLELKGLTESRPGVPPAGRASRIAPAARAGGTPLSSVASGSYGSSTTRSDVQLRTAPPTCSPSSEPPASASRGSSRSSPGGWARTPSCVRGRCLPYGEGITFWPLAEIVGAAAGLAEADSPAEATRKVELLIEGEHDSAEVAGQLAEIVGLAEGELTAAPELPRARRLLETLGTGRSARRRAG